MAKKSMIAREVKRKKLVKKYPKSSEAIGGAVGYDIFDDD